MNKYNREKKYWESALEILVPSFHPFHVEFSSSWNIKYYNIYMPTKILCSEPAVVSVVPILSAFQTAIIYIYTVLLPRSYEIYVLWSLRF